MNDKKILTLGEACQLTGYKKSYMYKLTSGGVIPYSKPNRKTLFFEREKLEAWMLSNSHPGSNEREVMAATHVATQTLTH